MPFHTQTDCHEVKRNDICKQIRSTFPLPLFVSFRFWIGLLFLVRSDDCLFDWSASFFFEVLIFFYLCPCLEWIQWKEVPFPRTAHQVWSRETRSRFGSILIWSLVGELKISPVNWPELGIYLNLNIFCTQANIWDDPGPILYSQLMIASHNSLPNKVPLDGEKQLSFADVPPTLNA